jgi:DnaJ-domain-containing protein 1
VEIVSILFMLGAGGALAVFVLTATAIARRESGGEEAAPLRRDSIAASLLFHIARAGGAAEDEALRDVRRTTGLAAPVTRGIDVGNWADTYARATTPQQRATLLESAVQMVAASGKPVPLRQYASLLDLSFGLGFQTDALAKLRQLYGFDYVDHARDARSRAAGGIPEPVESRSELLSVLGVAPGATRQEISSAYRRLVAQHHPDRFHRASAEERSSAADRFIEITRAYEELLLQHRD